MRTLLLVAAALASPWPSEGGAAAPATRAAELSRDDIRRSPAGGAVLPFLYAVLPTEQDIGILYYEPATPLGVAPGDVDRNRAKLHHCADLSAFQPECDEARKLETHWFKADAFGLKIWYSRDLAGRPQCYSLDGVSCLATVGEHDRTSWRIDDAATLGTLATAEGLGALFVSREEIRVQTYNGFWTGRIVLPPYAREGAIFHLEVDSEWPVDVSGELVREGEVRAWVFSAGRWHNGDFNPNEITNKLAARPLRCDAQEWDGYAFCQRLRAVERTYHGENVDSLVERKLAHMSALFDQYRDWTLATVDRNGNYTQRLRALDVAIGNKTVDRDWACYFAWTIWAAAACAAYNVELDALDAERSALERERSARNSEALASVAEKREQQWHTLHRTWASSDQTHFAALLREESKSLDELQTLARDYAKTAQAQHAAYLDAVAQYEHAVSPLGYVEHLPLIGPEIRHIEDYAKDPSPKNLRRMLLGLTGPAGEAVEGVVALTTGDGALSAGETRFLTDMLGALTAKSEFTTVMEEVVADAINDLGDEAVDSLRQVGLLDDRNGTTDELRDLDYASIPDLRARALPAAYDPWTAGGEAAHAFRTKFTPRAAGVVEYLSGRQAYDPASLTNIELASGGAAFAHALDTLFSHAMGAGYVRVVDRNPGYTDWTRAQVAAELYKVVADPAYAEARRPYWVTSAAIGRRHAALLYDNDHAVIVLNADLVDPAEDWSKYYIEELGHLVNWWRCGIFDVDHALCVVNGDVGARFRDAVLIDPTLHDASYDALLTELPVHADVDRVPARFSTGRLAWIDGWPDVYTIGDRIASKTSFSFLMRAGLDIDSEYPGLSDEFDIELVIGTPKPAQRGNPWRKSANGYCRSDAQTDCNMPTMWLAVSFRDALKYSIAGMPKLKSTAFGKSGVDLSPRIVRKHGGKLPFQLSSVDGTAWRYMGDSSIYFKKFTLAAEAKIDLWKMGHAMKGASPSSIHKPEFGAKAVPAEGSWTVEIAARDSADFAGWLAGDILSATLGCAGGFVVALVSEQDPVTLCHGFSDALEIAESAFQLLDKRPTIVLEGDGSVSLPSLEYKYATSGKAVRAGASSLTGRATYHVDQGTGVAALEEAPGPAASAVGNPQVDSLKTRMGKGLSKLGSRGIKPIAVFRMRVNFDYGQAVVRPGAYDLPSAVVTE